MGKIFTHILDTYNKIGGKTKNLQNFPITEFKIILRKILKSGIKFKIIIDILNKYNKSKELLKALRNTSENNKNRFKLFVSNQHKISINKKFSNIIIVNFN
jgi:hypothetical protein